MYIVCKYMYTRIFDMRHKNKVMHAALMIVGCHGLDTTLGIPWYTPNFMTICLNYTGSWNLLS